MNTIKDRIRIFCDRYNLKVSTFEKTCGFCNGYVNGIRRSVSPEKLSIILNKYPDLCRDWLVFGTGLMLKTDTPEKMEREVQANIKKRLLIFITTYTKNDLLTFAESLGLDRNYFVEKEIIEESVLERIFDQYPTLNRQWINYGCGSMTNGDTITIYDRIKSEFDKHDIDFSKWEVDRCGFSQGTLARCKGKISQTRLNIIADALPKEVDKDWILAGENGLSNSSAAEPSVPYLVRMYEQKDAQKSAPTNENLVLRETHLIGEGTKGLVIPINLSRNPKAKLSDISSQEIELGKIMPSFKFLYQVQTHQLEPMVSQGDWLMLDSISLQEVVNNEIYLLNTNTYGVMVRCFQWVSEQRINLINIDNTADILEIEPADINDICAITSILRNCTSFLPFAHTALGQSLMERDRMLQSQMDISREMFEELKKNNQRTDTLIELLVKKM